MKIVVCINDPGIPGGVVLDLPDDYEIGPRLWHDVQDCLIEKLLEARQAGQVAKFITGLDGDMAFRSKMEKR